MIRRRLIYLFVCFLVAPACKGLEKNVRATGVRRVEVKVGNNVSALIEFADEGGTYESWKEVPEDATTPKDQEEAAPAARLEGTFPEAEAPPEVARP